MNSKKFFFVLIGVISIIVVGGAYGAFWFNSKLVAKSNELQELKLENYAQNLQQQSTRRSAELLETYSDVPELTSAIVPQDKDQAKTIVELSQIAVENGITLNGFTFPGSTLGTLSPRSASRAADNKAAQPLSQLEPVDGLAGVYVLKVSTGSASTIPYPVLINFLSDLENNRRTAQVSNLSVTPDSETPSLVNFNIQLTLYIKP